MRSLITIVVMLSTPLTALACEGITGRWEAVSRTEGTLGQSFEFAADGVVYVTLAAMVDGNYTVEGNQMTTRIAGAKPGEIITTVYKMTPEEGFLTLEEPKSGNRQKMKRFVASDAKQPHIGTWSWKHPAGPYASTRFTRDGRMIFRLPITTQKGSYKCSGKTLSMEIPKIKPESRKVAFDGNTLILSASDGTSAKRFTRDN